MFWKLLLIAIGIWTLFVLLKRRRFYILEKELTSCELPSLPLLGHAYKLAGSSEVRMNAVKQISYISIKNGGVTTAWIVNNLYVVITDPVIAEVILKNCYDKDDNTTRILRTLFGNGSIFAPTYIWRPRRKIMTPMFSIKNLNAFVPVFATYSTIMADQLEVKSGKGDFSFWDYINAYTFDSVCKTTLGIELNSLSTRNHPFCEATANVFHLMAQRLGKPWIYLDYVYQLYPEYKTFMTQRQIMFDYVDEVPKCKFNLETDSKEMEPFIEMLMKSSGKQKAYTDLELREEIMVITVAGTDTSAVGAAYTTVMLSRHPDIHEKVFQELKEVFGDSDRPVSVQDLPNLRYLEAVIKESLRMYPPVPVITREVQNDVKLPSGTTLVKDVKGFISFWGLHRNPKYWGDDAEVFRPERFVEGPLKHPGQFMPFSSISRNCLGSKYAMMSMQTVLSTLLRRYRVLPPSGLDPQKWTEPLTDQFDVMMKHVDNYVIRIEKRY